MQDAKIVAILYALASNTKAGSQILVYFITVLLPHILSETMPAIAYPSKDVSLYSFAPLSGFPGPLVIPMN
jgi:hypothetical protein